MKEFDEDVDKLLAEHQQELESDHHEEFTQELKGRITHSLRGHVHVERECCVMVLRDQLSIDSHKFERVRIQIAHTRIALNEGCGETQLNHGVYLQWRDEQAQNDGHQEEVIKANVASTKVDIENNAAKDEGTSSDIVSLASQISSSGSALTAAIAVRKKRR